MREPIQFGKHTLHFEEPGIAVITYRGNITLDEMRVLAAVPEFPEHQRKFQLTLCHMKNFGGVESAARRAGTDREWKSEQYFVAYVNASFSTRIMANMWTRAMNVLKGPKNHLGFFDDHESAKAWLVEQRRKILAGETKK